MSETPNGTIVIARTADGRELDITEGVKALYDLCTSSMDWGSQFLSVEEAGDVIRVAQTCGFLVTEQAAEMFEGYAAHDAKVRQFGGGMFGLGGDDTTYEPPEKTDVHCVICGRDVFHMPSYYRADVYERSGIAKGWHHVDMEQDNGHAPRLWETAK